MPFRPDTVFASAQRKRLKREYEALFSDLAAFFFDIDPMGLNYEINPDEYEPEVGTILPRILELDDQNEVAAVIRDEFDRWFGSGTAVQTATYVDLAEGVLRILRRYRSQ